MLYHPVAGLRRKATNETFPMRLCTSFVPLRHRVREKFVHPFRWLTIALFALVLAACSGGAPTDAEVVLPQGASIAKAGEILEAAGLVSASRFRSQARFFGSAAPLKPAWDKVAQGMDAGD